VLDSYSRYVLAWELDQTLAIDFVLAAMGRAVGQTTPEDCNSDQDNLFTSPQWAALLAQARVRPSGNGKRRALVLPGGHDRGTTVAFGQVRGGLPARLRQRA